MEAQSSHAAADLMPLWNAANVRNPHGGVIGGQHVARASLDSIRSAAPAMVPPVYDMSRNLPGLGSFNLSTQYWTHPATAALIPSPGIGLLGQPMAAFSGTQIDAAVLCDAAATLASLKTSSPPSSPPHQQEQFQAPAASINAGFPVIPTIRAPAVLPNTGVGVAPPTLRRSQRKRTRDVEFDMSDEDTEDTVVAVSKRPNAKPAALATKHEDDAYDPSADAEPVPVLPRPPASASSAPRTRAPRVTTTRRERRFQCRQPGCTRAFRSAKDLESHTNSHLGLKPHICAVCKKGFAHPSNLKVHERAHRQERRYKCRFSGCDKRFAHPTSRKDHESSKHMGKKSYACAFCGTRFAARSNRLRHEKRAHPEEMAAARLQAKA